MKITAEMFDGMKQVTNENGGSSDRITTYWPPRRDERKEGDIVAGRYIGAVTFSKGQADETTYYKLRNEDEIYGVRESAVIKRAFSSIDEGTVVAVRYNGVQRGKNGRNYNDFDVRIIDDAKTPEPKEEPKEEPKHEEIDLSSIPF